MSKKELKRWENKYRLYSILHDFKINIRGHHGIPCHYCREKNAGCPIEHLIIDESGKKMAWYSSITRLTGTYYCAEWIKYV